ncbi:hypothetical protein [Mesobacillus maritimus]|uniref:Uncharacterized protein n=1 Tax=Mesobacillus maritimus TaxID=1643336 RepID=A0ABS7KAW8_9BACI|nr:hypothetical protein [Mesobacillus maritimus]MBY0099211.1 hypothetical protein [Mesobacillus maritimus]
MKWKIHRCNCREVWAIQSRKKKMTADTILLKGDWMTELKPERHRNPKGFVTTLNTEEVILDPSQEVVHQFTKGPKLIYDKKNVDFNQKNGKYLYFAADGTCYMLNPD